MFNLGNLNDDIQHCACCSYVGRFEFCLWERSFTRSNFFKIPPCEKSPHTTHALGVISNKKKNTLNKNINDIKLLSQPLSSDIDHLSILQKIYNNHRETRNPFSNLMKYYLDGLDELPTKKQKSLWNEQEYLKSRKLFNDRFFELLEIPQNDYSSFKYNFEIVESEKLTVEKFREYPIWSEYYDFNELDEIEDWGFNRDAILQELKIKEIESQHPYYTVPISDFPPERMRYFTKAKFKTINGLELDGAIMNEGNGVIAIFLNNEYISISNHPSLQDWRIKSLKKISSHYNISLSELNQLDFETEIPKDVEKRMKGKFFMNGEFDVNSRDINNITKSKMEFEEDWIYIGVSDDLNRDKLSKILTIHFEDYPTILVKRIRHNSEEINLEVLVDKTVKLIGVEDFELWSNDSKRAIKFNKIGVINKSK